MAKITRNFIAGIMNKDIDERLVPNGQHIHGQNLRINSTESSDKGVIENSIGNVGLTEIKFNGQALSSEARTIGAIADEARETLYWFVHDPQFAVGATGKLDLILSYNAISNNLTYHVVSIDDGGGGNTTLNFNPQYLITGVNFVDNLLFFTDNYNAPRCINITRQYAAPIANIDQFENKEILVIKQPPVVPLVVTPLTINSEDTYMEERFLCFAYRYRYQDGEYSATTQFTDPIFFPKSFAFETSSYLNEGMINSINGCILSYNTGDKEVVSVDLLYKEAGSNIVRIIERIEKTNNLPDNSTQTYGFSNQKVFTILPESELLRLYDNVPRYAKAQTLMGNRLMYGNYTEGYDLIADDNLPVRLEYEIDLISETPGLSDLVTQIDQSTYLYGGITIANDTLIAVDLSTEAGNLVEGAVISIDISFQHGFYTGAVVPTDVLAATNINFTFILPKNYNSVYELAISPEFQSSVGLVGEIEPAPNSCVGIRFTDQFNCLIPDTRNNFTRIASGINAADEPIAIFASPSSDVIAFQIIATEYQEAITLNTAYAFYEVTEVSAFFQKTSNNGSLHSNRSYEVGMIYMDEYLRSTTVLTSPDNNLFIPCQFSANQNKIQVTIPPTQRPPSWAKYFKFGIKTDREGYEIIYSLFFIRDTETTDIYCLLEGENARKAEEGDRLTVKSDTSGAATSCQYTTILEKKAQEKDFLGVNNPAPSGVYIKLNSGDFNAEINPNSIIDEGNRIEEAGSLIFSNLGEKFPIMSYPTNKPDPLNPGNFIDYTVPAGSRIVLSFQFRRLGRGDGTGACERRIYTYDKSFISSAEYPSFEAWFKGDLIDRTINDGISDVGDNSGDILNTFIPLTATVRANAITPELGRNFWRFFRDPATNESSLLLSGTAICSGTAYPENKTKSTVSARIQVFRADNLLVFETQPQDTLPDVYYEGSQLFEIDSLRQHEGNVQNQNYVGNLPAIIDTNFYNCYSFGNGVESYKIRDSIVGKQFNLGNRVMAVAGQDYKEAKRFADITYSGVYNNETNVNKFNEFNLGLLNFKQLERRFGEIYILDGRETDVRVLQEDKVSYVLEGKNLLSDASAGGVIASIPEVLGTQMARIEEFGISANPESYARYGRNVFFTDAKRGAVLMLSGVDRGESMTLISDLGMGSWFRDIFINNFSTQKLGGFDPYMDEYVLTINDQELPVEQECLSCGNVTTYTFTNDSPIQYCVNLGNSVGTVTVSYQIISVVGDIEIEATYNSITTTSGEVNVSGSFTFQKDSISENNVVIDLSTLSGTAVVQVSVSCPLPETLRVVQVSVTNNSDSGKFIHNQYRYVDTPFVSPLQSTLVEFAVGSTNPLVSQYSVLVGAQGLGAIPTNGSTVTLISNKIDFDNFNFDVAQHRFRYLRSNTLYNNTQADISALLAAATTATPITGSGNTFQADFIMPSSGDYLYLIWDYRTAYEIDMCFDSVNSRGLCCCGCQP
jgi:hypothetical protein